MTSEHRKLKTRHETLITQHEHLKVGHEDLKDLYNKADSRVRALETLQDGNQERALRDLQARYEENEALIASQEGQLEDYRLSKERQERELSSLRPNAVRVKELMDETKELKSQNDALAKKANMVDHFQRKLETMNQVERENKSLHGRIDVLERNMQDYNEVFQLNQKLTNTIEEYQIKFEGYEREHNTLSSEYSVAKRESRQKEEELETLKARQAADEAFIRDLQEQVRSSSGTTVPASPGSPTRGHNLTLEEELEQAPDSTPNYLLEISRLQAENQLLKSGSAGNAATLRIDLEESDRKCKRLSENLRDLTEQQAITQKQLEAVLKTSTHEKYVLAVDEALKVGPMKMLMVEFYRDNAIASTRDLERKASEELASTKLKLADLQTDLTAHHRDLLAARADCKFCSLIRSSCTNSVTVAAIDQDELQALDDLKQTNEIITTSLNDDLKLLQNRHKNLIIDFDQQRAHLVESLLDRENLRKDLESAKTNRTAPLDLTEAEDGADEKQAKLQSIKEVSHIQYTPSDSKQPKSPGRFAKFFKPLLSHRPKKAPGNHPAPQQHAQSTLQRFSPSLLSPNAFPRKPLPVKTRR